MAVTYIYVLDFEGSDDVMSSVLLIQTFHFNGVVHLSCSLYRPVLVTLSLFIQKAKDYAY